MRKNSEKRLLVLGNGPSLKSIDLSRLAGCDTLGMNAAYRYWKRIDWRPTHYACLDDALIDTHKDEISALIEERRIDRFFLTGRMLEHFPDLAGNERINFLDQYVKHWHVTRGQKYGLEYTEHPAFTTQSPNMLTTGSYSVRFAAVMDYRAVLLLGVDLSYEALSAARALEGTRLVMDATPTENPNYFFSDYQAAGDQFNVANPAVHGRDLHLHSFLSLRDDFIRNQVGVRISNASARSQLFKQAVLPFTPFDPEFEGEKSPRHRTLRLQLGENFSSKLENIFWLWSQPAFFPLLGDPSDCLVDLIVSSPYSHPKRVVRALDRIVKRYPSVRACFRDVRMAPSSHIGSEDPASAGSPQSPFNSREFHESLLEPADPVVTPSKYRLDEQSIPISCDWLGSLMSSRDSTHDVLELRDVPKSIEGLNEHRSEALDSLFVRSVGLGERVRNLRATCEPVTLESLLAAKADGDQHSGAPGGRSFGLKRWFKHLPI